MDLFCLVGKQDDRLWEGKYELYGKRARTRKGQGLIQQTCNSKWRGESEKRPLLVHPTMSQQ